MTNIFWGAVIIAVGLYFGRSVFLGDFSFLNVFFDALGLFWIGKGLLSLRKSKVEAQPGEPPSNPV